MCIISCHQVHVLTVPDLFEVRNITTTHIIATIVSLMSRLSHVLWIIVAGSEIAFNEQPLEVRTAESSVHHLNMYSLCLRI